MRVVPKKVTTTVKVQQGETLRKSKKGVIIRADLARLPRACDVNAIKGALDLVCTARAGDVSSLPNASRQIP